MAYAISLFFDPTTDESVRELWQAVEASGISSFLSQGHFHPHLTLAIYERIDLAQAQTTLRALAASHPSLPVALPSLGTFPGAEGVVFLAATMTDALLRLHCQVHAQFAEFADAPAPYYLPDHWNPHCSIARDLRREQVPPTIALCQSLVRETITGTLTQIGLIETPAEVEVCRHRLG